MGPVSRGVDVVNTMGRINSRVGGECATNISQTLTHTHEVTFSFSYMPFIYIENSGHANESIGETRV